MKKLIVGIEGVALSQSAAAIADYDGNLYALTRQPFSISLHSSSRRELRIGLHKLLSAVMAQHGLKVPDLRDSTLVVGLTGVTFPFNAEVELPNEVRQMGFGFGEIVCTGDVEIVFASHCGSREGSAILSHMGSTAFVMSDGQTKRYGGWGPVLGDEGSAYAMGRATLRAICEDYDEQRDSALWYHVERWLKQSQDDHYLRKQDWGDRVSVRWLDIVEALGESDRRPGLFSFAHDLLRNDGLFVWRALASSLVIPLMDAHEEGDPTAIRIVSDATSELLRQHSRACSLAKVSPTFGPIVLYGGALSHNKRFQKEVIRQLETKLAASDEAPTCITAASAGVLPPICGSLLLGMGESNTGNLSFPSARRREQLRLSYSDFMRRP